MKESKLPSKRKLWAMKRNWLIRRFKGAHTLFSDYEQEHMRTLLNEEDWPLINKLNTALGFMINKLSQSKYKE